MVSPFHHQENCIPFAVIRLPDFGASKVPTNVRLWLLADIRAMSELRPLYPQQRTFKMAMSALSPISSALPPIADVLEACARLPLLTQSGPIDLFDGLKSHWPQVSINVPGMRPEASASPPDAAIVG